MSKVKRLLAVLLTAVMAVSVLSVLTFASVPVFSQDYVDPTGTITTMAYIVTSKADGVKKNTNIIESWDGVEYQFTVGVNAFATVDEAREASITDMKLDTVQLLLTPGLYEEITIDESVEIFGVHWNVNPNAVDENDPTQPWTLNAEWNKETTKVGNFIVEANSKSVVGLYGVEFLGKFMDNRRAQSALKTTVTVKNVRINQDEDIVNKTGEGYFGVTGASIQRYAIFTFRNKNNYNLKDTGKTNKDEVKVENVRIDNVASLCARLFDEWLPPVFTVEGLYVETADFKNATYNGPSGSKGSCSAVLGYTKYSPYFTNVKATLKNSCIIGNSPALYFEGFTDATGSNSKQVIGSLLEGQTAEMNICNNLLYNVVKASSSIQVWPKSFNKVNIDGNYVVNTTGSFPTYDMFINLNNLQDPGNSTAVTEDYSNLISITNNTLLGFNKLYFKYGVDTTKIDTTGNYICDTYSADNWINSTSDLRPTGHVRYDYTWTNAKRTEKVDGVENFSINGANIDHDALTITVELGESAGSSYVPSVKGISKYAIYESDSEFSNENNFEEQEALTTLSVRNYNSYFIFVAYTDDTNYKVYKYTVTRKATDKVELSNIGNLPEGSTVFADGLEIYATVPRDIEDVNFTIESEKMTKAVVMDASNNHTVKPVDGKYAITGLKPGETKEFIARITNNNVSVFYYVYIKRALSTECEIVSLDPTMTLDGKTITVTLPNCEPHTFNVEVSDRATVSVWSGTTAFDYNDETNEITIGGFTTAKNEYTLAVVAEDGTTINEYKLVINVPHINPGADSGFSIAGAEKIDESIYLLQVAKDAKMATLKITAEDCTYKLYADPSFTVPAATNITIDQGYVYIYAKVDYNNGETGYVTIVIESERSASKYSDASSIPTWAKKYVDELNNTGFGIIQGDNLGNFNPNKNVTRYEIATIAVRVLGIDASQFASVKLNYSDKISDWALNSVKAVTQIGIMSGTTSNGKTVFNGKGYATRSQLAKIIVEMNYKMIGIDVNEYYEACKTEIDSAYNEYNFADENTVQSWAKPYVRIAVMAGYIQGSKDGNNLYIKGNTYVTRAQTATIIARYIGVGIDE